MRRLLAGLGIFFISFVASVSTTAAGTCELQCWENYVICAEDYCGGAKCPDCVDWYNHCLDYCV